MIIKICFLELDSIRMIGVQITTQTEQAEYKPKDGFVFAQVQTQFKLGIEHEHSYMEIIFGRPVLVI